MYKCSKNLNQYKQNGFSYSYQLDHLLTILGVLGGIFHFFHIVTENSEDPHAVSNLDQHCLPTSHKNDARLIWVKKVGFQ